MGYKSPFSPAFSTHLESLEERRVPAGLPLSAIVQVVQITPPPLVDEIVAPVVESVVAPAVTEVVAPVVEPVASNIVAPVVANVVEPVVASVVAPVVSTVAADLSPVVDILADTVTPIPVIAETAPVVAVLMDVIPVTDVAQSVMPATMTSPSDLPAYSSTADSRLPAASTLANAFPVVGNVFTGWAADKSAGASLKSAISDAVADLVVRAVEWRTLKADVVVEVPSAVEAKAEAPVVHEAASAKAAIEAEADARAIAWLATEAVSAYVVAEAQLAAGRTKEMEAQLLAPEGPGVYPAHRTHGELNADAEPESTAAGEVPSESLTEQLLAVVDAIPAGVLPPLMAGLRDQLSIDAASVQAGFDQLADGIDALADSLTADGDLDVLAGRGLLIAAFLAGAWFARQRAKKAKLDADLNGDPVAAGWRWVVGVAR